jgi:hypothetical protein
MSGVEINFANVHGGASSVRKAAAATAQVRAKRVGQPLWGNRCMKKRKS